MVPTVVSSAPTTASCGNPGDTGATGAGATGATGDVGDTGGTATFPAAESSPLITTLRGNAEVFAAPSGQVFMNVVQLLEESASLIASFALAPTQAWKVPSAQTQCDLPSPSSQ